MNVIISKLLLWLDIVLVRVFGWLIECILRNLRVCHIFSSLYARTIPPCWVVFQDSLV